MEFNQTKAKEPNRYEIIGIQKEATKVMNQIFSLEIPFLDGCYSQGKFYTEHQETYTDEYGVLLCYFLNEANDLMFTFENKETEEEIGTFRLDLSVWNGSFNNPLKKI